MSVVFRLRLTRPGFTLDAAAELPGLGITAVFGRSGCGKTTLLRCLAGLEPAAEGEVIVAGETWQSADSRLPAHQRSVGYVFQDGRLFPHLDVRGNLNFGYRRAAPARVRLRPDDVIGLLGLAPLMDRRVAGLSGGERQRVAIGRALLTSPDLLLLDEPLAALDAISKAEILPWLERLHAELRLPVLLVTHARDEVARLADHLLLLDNGSLLAEGPPAQLFTRADLALSATDDAAALLDAEVSAYDETDRLLELRLGVQTLWVPAAACPPVGAVRLSIQARDVSLAMSAPEDCSLLNCLDVTVCELSGELQPGELLARLDIAGQPLLARISMRSARQLDLVPGMRLKALVKAAVISGAGAAAPPGGLHPGRAGPKAAWEDRQAP
ncbi:MAG: molybdenum ABC transporter ATP-binding protein [Chromatiales bacterium]|nr:molybdenum ABC transporter ATP-binding protein [Chromatiales bacterium]